MYNQLFTKILDSSLWLEPDPTRIVWVTLLAAMDETGFCSFASVRNLAHRARVTDEECNAAVTVLEGPDANSSDPDNEGRRIERVPGGWMVLNAPKYKKITTRNKSKEQTKLRVQKHRARKTCNAPVTQCNDSVAPSESGSESGSNTYLTNRTDEAERPNGSKVSERGEERQARGPDLDLSGVDWGEVASLAEAVAKKVPLRADSASNRNNDRRQWIKYAVLAERGALPHSWLIDAADRAGRSPDPKKSKRAIFVALLVETCGMAAKDFHGMVRRINLPSEIWKSGLLGGPR